MVARLVVTSTSIPDLRPTTIFDSASITTFSCSYKDNNNQNSV